LRRDMTETADFAKTRQARPGKPDDSTKIATTPIATQYRCYRVGS
jgi:hypothetical protein